jgi:ATP synthase protein I
MAGSDPRPRLGPQAEPAPGTPPRRGAAGDPHAAATAASERAALRSRIERAAARRARAIARGRPGLAFSLALFGRVGWAIATPTLLGTLLGVWLDRRIDGSVSWTLTLMLLGLALGCASAWAWVRKEVTEHEHDR